MEIEDYSKACAAYRARGLKDYQLRSKEDVKTLYMVDIEKTNGYLDLTEENKKLFAGHVVNAMNTCSMKTRAKMHPAEVHYVKEIEFLRECEPSQEDEVKPGQKIYEHFGSKLIAIKADGEEQELKKYFFQDGLTENDAVKTTEKKYLRVDWEIGSEKTWYHVITEKIWY